MKRLKILKIINGKIEKMERFVFSKLKNLLELHLNDSELPEKEEFLFIKNLKNLEKIFTNKFSICCLATKFCPKLKECKSERNFFELMCKNLINS